MSAKMHPSANAFVTGILYFFSGFSWLLRPGIRRFVIIPFIINCLCFIGLIWLGAHFYGEFTGWFEHLLPSWLQWLGWLLWIFFILAASIVLVYTFTLLANLVGAPFNGFLAEKVVQQHTGVQATNGTTIWQAVVDVPRALARQLKYTAYYLLRAIAALILFLIPGVQIIASPVWFILNSWMMSIQYLDYPMDNEKIDFAKMRQDMGQQRLLCFGFGLAALVATLIPFINFFVMPTAVIGASLLFADYFKK